MTKIIGILILAVAFLFVIAGAAAVLAYAAITNVGQPNQHQIDNFVFAANLAIALFSTIFLLSLILVLRSIFMSFRGLLPIVGETVVHRLLGLAAVILVFQSQFYRFISALLNFLARFILLIPQTFVQASSMKLTIASDVTLLVIVRELVSNWNNALLELVRTATSVLSITPIIEIVLASALWIAIGQLTKKVAVPNDPTGRQAMLLARFYMSLPLAIRANAFILAVVLVGFYFSAVSIVSLGTFSRADTTTPSLLASLFICDSYSVAIIVGILGWGLLGSAVSVFLRQSNGPGQNQDVTALGPVIVRGVSAAFVVYLAVHSGIGAVTEGGGRPNSYVVLFLGFVGAVFSEYVWKWAQTKLRQQLPIKSPATRNAATSDRRDHGELEGLLDARIVTALSRAGINNLEDLRNKTPKDLLAVKGIGAAFVAKIETALR